MPHPQLAASAKHPASKFMPHANKCPNLQCTDHPTQFPIDLVFFSPLHSVILSRSSTTTTTHRQSPSPRPPRHRHDGYVGESVFEAFVCKWREGTVFGLSPSLRRRRRWNSISASKKILAGEDKSGPAFAVRLSSLSLPGEDLCRRDGVLR